MKTTEQPKTKAQLEEQTLEHLQHLHTRSIDAAEGYGQASDLSENKELATFFANNASKRKNFALELEGLIRTMGAEPKPDGSILAKMHQTWMTVVEKFGADEEALLEECERGEETALNDYEEALASFELSNAAVAIVERQRDEIRKELASVKTLRTAVA